MLDKELMKKIFDLQMQIEEENKGLSAFFQYCFGGLDADISNYKKTELIKVSAYDHEEDGNEKLENYLKQLGMYLVLKVA